MAGKDIYEENKRLRADIERLGAQLQDERTRHHDDGEVVAAAFTAFVKGNAHLLIEACNDPGSRVVRFVIHPAVQP